MAEIEPAGCYRFDGFSLDTADRRLLHDGAPVELSGRYFDALILLVSEAGKLVTKDRFMAQVWRGVPVTDEALTQCIRMLRRQLGDDAARPRLIETVPKHGYRFIASVQASGDLGPLSKPSPTQRETAPPRPTWHLILVLMLGGTLGGAIAGFTGGLLYGFIASSQPGSQAMGGASLLLVLTSITTLIAVLGAAGVATGIATAQVVNGRTTAWNVLGGAVGGLVVGAIVKLIGNDAFGLLIGRSPGDVTGAAEGMALGAAIGLAAWLSGRGAVSLRRAALLGASSGGAAGLAIAALGGRLMAGSLDQLARRFEGSELELGPIAGMVGEADFGPLSLALTAALEGILFGAFVVAGMAAARRVLAAES